MSYAKDIRFDDGALPPNQLESLLALLLTERPSVVLEIGTFHGSTTRAMAEALPDAVIHTLDLPLDVDMSTIPCVPGSDIHLIARREVGREFKHLPCAARIRQHYGNSFTWDFAEVGHPDFCFIDASHSYDGCRNDSEKCLTLRPTTIVWHDYDGDHPGVSRLIYEWRGAGRDIRQINGMPLAYWRGIDLDAV